MDDSQHIEDLLREREPSDFRWIDPAEIVVAHWVRMKCRFGCAEYGRNACCPPNTPEVSECEAFFRDYRRAVILRFEKRVDRPEDRHAWSRAVNQGLLELERAVFLAGHRKAFLLFMDSCYNCETCAGRRERCKEPRMARPSPEAMAVDVFATVGTAGFPIEVLNDYSRPMNRYAFLMVD